MAGSYEHCTKPDGTFREGEDFRGMIENLGDAEEACEQMHWMVRYLAGENEDRIAAASEAFFAHKRGE